jgi:hypothetical protein
MLLFDWQSLYGRWKLRRTWRKREYGRLFKVYVNRGAAAAGFPFP